MSQEVKQRKITKNKKNFIGLFISILIYLLISFTLSIFGISNKTILPETAILYDKINCQGVVIKDEFVYNSKGSGQLNIIVKEGDRIPVGTKVANISMLQDNSKLKQELLEIEQRIETLSKSDKNSKNQNDKSEVDNLKQAVLEEIQENINSNSFIEIQNDKEKLQTYNDYATEDTLLIQSLDSLKKEKEILIKQINSNNISYYSQNSGIVSYEIDGYESIYLPKEFENYTYDIFNLDNKKVSKDKFITNDEVMIGNPIFKIINNFEWYIAIKVEDNTLINEYECGQAILCELEDGSELNGRIVSINNTNNNSVLVVKYTTYIHENYNLRFPSISIIKSKQDSYKIPSEVIVEKDGNKGVFIKEINGIVKFRRISILGIEGKDTFINKGDHNGYIQFEGDDKPVRTVTLFDEIFYDPLSVTEGEILN